MRMCAAACSGYCLRGNGYGNAMRMAAARVAARHAGCGYSDVMPVITIAGSASRPTVLCVKGNQSLILLAILVIAAMPCLLLHGKGASRLAGGIFPTCRCKMKCSRDIHRAARMRMRARVAGSVLKSRLRKSHGMIVRYACAARS